MEGLISNNGKKNSVVNQPTVLKIVASVASYIFHPIFIPLYCVGFIAYVHPNYFSGFSDNERLKTILITLQNAVFYPLFSVLLLKGVGFIDSILLKTKKDRIIPYIACGIFFFWTFTVFKEQPSFPRILPSFFLGVFLSSSAALLANIYFKISMHAIGVGGMLGLCFVIFNGNSILMTWPLAAALLIAGLVCTSRLIISDHSPKDIYSGLAIGILMQFVAAFVIL
ncbi:MAG TPA: hypothetical protein PK504_04670 [Ferruginibacter sp.]|nr:hypothetical protein [Ferruginibacter sp.]HRE63569.1 hypothetical protein [Ferruginibacter sp.]